MTNDEANNICKTIEMMEEQGILDNKKLLTDFLNDLKAQVGTYRIKHIETERAVEVFLESKKNK